MNQQHVYIDPADWPQKAYKNLTFLNSPDAREIRVLCEFMEPESRFRRLGVRNTIVFFGSARTLSGDVAAERLRQLERESAGKSDVAKDMAQRLDKARRDLTMSRYYDDAAVLSERLTAWSGSVAPADNQFMICSGGGPGIMEAANRGAAAAGGKSIGLNISLPFEQQPNSYQIPELCFEFHYFFIRKFWFAYLAKAMVVFPGGFGTLDELFELLTLVQTGKTSKPMPIIVYGREYWDELLNWDAMVKWGTISPEDLDLFSFCDTVDEAFEYLTSELTRLHLDGKNQ